MRELESRGEQEQQRRELKKIHGRRGNYNNDGLGGLIMKKNPSGAASK